MDVLTHLFLPLTAAYAVRTDFFEETPLRLGLAGFGLLPDFDKFLGSPGLLHSLVTLFPLCAGALAAEWLLQGRLEITPWIVAFVASHLLLDVVDGGPVPLLFPFVETGIGLQYPVRTVFGDGPLGVRWQGDLATLRTTAPRPGYNTYGFVRGAGVASFLTFVTVFLGLGRDGTP